MVSSLLELAHALVGANKANSFHPKIKKKVRRAALTGRLQERLTIRTQLRL
jgi:hypothetical protein